MRRRLAFQPQLLASVLRLFAGSVSASKGPCTIYEKCNNSPAPFALVCVHLSILFEPFLRLPVLLPASALAFGVPILGWGLSRLSPGFLVPFSFGLVAFLAFSFFSALGVFAPERNESCTVLALKTFRLTLLRGTRFRPPLCRPFRLRLLTSILRRMHGGSEQELAYTGGIFLPGKASAELFSQLFLAAMS